MEQDNKKRTIKDVARMAGVSKGTVDRVVHNRGEVSEKSKRKVLEVIEKIGYKPNIYASMLASRRSYTIACLIPSHSPGEFWELVNNGIERARSEEGNYNVEIEEFVFDQFDEDSFRMTCEKLLACNPSAVILAPMYRDIALALTSELDARCVPYVFIDSRLEGVGYMAYFGMPMYHSGYLAASLLFDGRDDRAVASFRIEHNQNRNNPVLRRSRGFADYIKEHRPECRIYEESIRPYDPEYNTKFLDEFFGLHPEIRLVAAFSSRVHLVTDYFKRRGLKDYRIVGFDMLSKNIESLREGYCKYLIANVTEMQIYRGIGALLEYLAFRKVPAIKDNYSSLDILTRYNVDYYFKN